MVAIDMPMPKGCKDCQFVQKYISAIGKRIEWCGINHHTLPRRPDTRPVQCPLIDLTDDGK